MNPVKNRSRLSSRLYSVSLEIESGATSTRAILAEFEGRDAAEGGDVLILFADRLAEKIDFDMAGLLGEHLARNEILIQRVQGAQQGDGEAAGGAEPGAGGNVGHADDFQVGRGHRHQPEGLADDGVLDLVDGLHHFGGRILDEVFGLEGLVERDVDVLIDGGGEDEASVLAVVGGKVGAASSEGDAQRGAGDDHACDSR